MHTTVKNDLHVVVIGGGIGGLCLAQGLKKAGVRATVCERDRTPTARLQGFRVHIDPQGSRALHDCLPEHLWLLFQSTCGDFSRGFTLLDEQLGELMKFRDAIENPDPVERHRSVSRITLRQVLLAGLGESVQFDKRFTHYEQRADGGLAAHFADGSTVEGDVLVAADGVGSRVRSQYLPGNEPIETGVISLGGRIPLTDGVMALLPPSLLDGPAIVMPPTPANLFMAAWRRSKDAKEIARTLNWMGRSETDPVREEGDYLVMALGAREPWWGIEGDPLSLSQPEMHRLLCSKLIDWHPNLRKLAEMMGEELGFLRIRTSQPVAPWTPTNITLLGDAIHSMTPYRGVGANTALRDATLLCSKLTAGARGEQPLLAAIGAYEAAMREYGFHAVGESLKSMEQAVSERRFGFRVAMSALRVANRIPVLRRKIFAQRVAVRQERTEAQAS